MQNQPQVFENKEFGKIRVIEKDGQPWFVGKDVTEVLSYENGSRDIKRHVDGDDINTEEYFSNCVIGIISSFTGNNSTTA